MKQKNGGAEKILAFTLKLGAYSAFACIVTGLVLHFAVAWASRITLAGFLVLLATPGLRIVVAGIEFSREREYRYVLISAGVLAVIVTAYVLGVQA